jgi:hypothetical protein
MTLVYDSKAIGPGTHALIVGAGAYPLAPPMALHVPATSAAAMAHWLTTEFRNPAAPLATIELLASAPGSDDIFHVIANGQSIRVSPPNFPHLVSSFEHWQRRVEADPGNIALFYFAGHGASSAPQVEPDTLLLLDDYSPGSNEGVASFVGLMAAMRPFAARQLYLVDTNRDSGPDQLDARNLLRLSTAAGRPRRARPRRATLYATAPGQLAYGRIGEPSVFVQGLMAAMREAPFDPHTGALRPSVIAAYANQWMAAAAADGSVPEQSIAPDILDDFDFHYAWRGRPAATAAQQPPKPVKGTGGSSGRAKSGASATARKEAAAALADRGAAPGGSVGVTPAGIEPLASPPEPEAASVAGTTPSPPMAPLPDSPPRPVDSAATGAGESNTEFVPDDAETERDDLGRSVLAIGLARRLHRIWRAANERVGATAGSGDRAAFVVHLDAPWGGGKTTFANFLARVLDPLPADGPPAVFLKERYGEADLGGIFLDDPPADAAAVERLASLPDHVRRPWIVVTFNAWQVEHCSPPWWVFYQTIRKGCFDAVRNEGDLPWKPGEDRPRLPWLQRMDVWAKLWLREIGWRLTNPKVRALLLTAMIGLIALLLLQWFGVWGASQGKDETKAGFILTSGFGLLLAGLTSVTALWGFAAVATESIVPGTDTLAERLSLGSGDPFARFRRHFARTIAMVRRPVMVVVDDLDRCRPDFVVDLVRGMQTLLRSPRLVFVILGDRDWIERAFEAHHKAMEKVDVGPEQTFGARFVEKAIQMSFILPAMGDDSRLDYVRRVLLGAPAEGMSEPVATIDADTAKAVREVANREAAAPDADPFDTERIVTRAMEELPDRREMSDTDTAALQRQVKQLVGETLAINATSSERVERAVAHQLEALAEHFPANPRQIKRIVNAITIYYAVALQRPDLKADEAFRTQLALWVIIMTEWPETWRLIASFPSLVEILQAGNPQAALAGRQAGLPGSQEATALVVRRIVADAELMALIKGGGCDPLDPTRIRLLAQLTPLHSRKRRLPEPDERPAAAPGAETWPAPADSPPSSPP